MIKIHIIHRPYLVTILAIVSGILVLISGFTLLDKIPDIARKQYKKYRELAMGAAVGAPGGSLNGLYKPGSGEKPSEKELREIMALITTIVWTTIFLGITTIIGGLIAFTRKIWLVRIGSILIIGSSTINMWLGAGYVLGPVIGVIAGIIGLFWEPKYRPKTGSKRTYNIFTDTKKT